MVDNNGEINIDDSKNENIQENDDKPFVNLENIDNIPKINNENEKNEIAIENNNIKKTSEITDEDNNSVTSNTESVSESQNELNINSKALYEESKKKLEPYQLKMIETIKNIENMVKTGERQRNYKIKSEFEREKG